MSLGVVAEAVEKMPKLNSVYPVEAHMIKLESELQPDSAESTYVRVIVWNTIPTSEDLQYHFDKFDLLKVEEKQLEYGKFDIIEKSESTYERFLYAYSTKQQLTVTIFVKVNFNNKENSSSMKYFITKVNCALKKYDFIDKGDIVCDEIHSNSSTTLIGFMLVILIPTVAMIYRLAVFYKIIGGMCSMIGFYPAALIFYKKELEIQQKILPKHHPDLASSYNKIGITYFKLCDYSKALLFYEKELEIRKELRSPNDPRLASLYNNIASVYSIKRDYENTLSWCNAAVKTGQKSLAPNNRQLQMYELNLKNLKTSNFNSNQYFVD